MSAVLLGAASRPAWAQDTVDRLLGRTVVSVRVEVEGRPASLPAIDALIQTHKDAPLRADELRSSIAQLYSAGHYDDISIVGHEVSGGVELVYRLVPRHEIDQIDFRGADLGLDRDALKRGLMDQFNGVPPRARMETARIAVIHLLNDEGFGAPTVTVEAQPTHHPDRATMIFTITAGPRARVHGVSVEGASPFSKATIIKRTGTALGSPYRPVALASALDAIQDDLRTREYYEATATFVPTPVGEGRDVDLVLKVDAGPIVTVRAEGDSLPAGKIEDYAPIKQQKSDDEDVLGDASRRIEAALKQDGYWHARAPFRKDSSNGRTVITFTVSRGPRFLLNSLTPAGNVQFDAAAIALVLGLPLQAPFDEAKLDAGVATLKRQYISQGFADVQIPPPVVREVAGSVTATSGLVDVQITIVEGPQKHVAKVDVAQLPAEARFIESDLAGVLRVHQDDTFVESKVLADRVALLLLCQNRGYERCVVDPTVEFSGDKRLATVTYDLAKGPQTIVGQIAIVGNHRISESTIRNHITLRTGTPLGPSEIDSTRQSLGTLQQFRRVKIERAPHPSGETLADLIVTVEEMPATTVTFGGGVQEDRRLINGQDKIEFSPRGLFQIGRRNLFGKNRSVNLFSSLALHRSDTGSGFGFSEYHVTGTFADPGVLGWKADALVGVTFEQAIRTDFNFLRKGVNAQIFRRTAAGLNISGSYSLDTTKLFDTNIPSSEQLLIDRVFPQVRLSTFSTTVVRDSRKNPVAPEGGSLLSVGGSLAARVMGSQVGFAKTFFEALGFHTLSARHHIVLAGAARLGLAWGFLRDVPVVDSNGQPVIGPDGQPLTQQIDDLPASERFFAGGATTVRGFLQDRLGVPSIVTSDGLSNGGNGLIILNGEVRMPVWKSVGVVGFVDTGNVFAKANQLDLAELRTSIGFGIRFKSPVGPLRFDYGFKLGTVLPTDHRRAEFHFSLGEAF